MQEAKVTEEILNDDDQVSTLDVILTVVENAKLLVFGSLLVGLCALGVGFLLPPTYQSVAVLQADQATAPLNSLNQAAASLMLTSTVLDPIIESFGLAKDESIEDARTRLRKEIKAVVGRTDKLLTLTVSARSPQQAQTIATAVLKRVFQESGPKGTIRQRLETQLAEARLRLKNAQSAAEITRGRLESMGTAGTISISNSELPRGYAELLGATSAAQSQVLAVETQLEGLSDAQIIQPPTLPEKPTEPKKGLIAIGATLGAGLALLIFIFVRQSLRNMGFGEASASKLLRIRKALHLR